MLIASLSFAVMGGFVKVVSEHLPALEVTFFRNIFGVVILGFSILKSPSSLKGGKPMLLIFRGAIGFLALLAYFYNMANIPLAQAVTYNKTAPLFLAFFAWIFLKEKLAKSAILALIIGFLGIVLIANPNGFKLNIYDSLGIFSGVGAALAYTSIRELRKFYDTKTIALSFMLAGTIGPLIFMLIGSMFTIGGEFSFMFSKFIMPSKIEWLYIAIIGLSATLSQLLLTKAYSVTKAGIIGTITYTEILFALIIGILLGDKFPDIYTAIGMSLITVAGLLVILEKEKS